jgi:hypothetical protein
MKRTYLSIDGREYELQVKHEVNLSASAPRLVIVAYQPNRLASALLQVCIQAVQKFTPEAHEIWVVDNHSPQKFNRWLDGISGVNVIWNLTEPLPRENRGMWHLLTKRQSDTGSYANAIALEIAARLVPADSTQLMSLHMDTMPCRLGWLSFLQSKLNERTPAAGVRMDKVRSAEGYLHVLGLLFDFQRFCKLGLNFMPELPALDVGDRISREFRKAGYQLFACRNTLWDPALVQQIPPSSPFYHLPVDRSFDDQGEVIFLHLGRGIRQTTGQHQGHLSVPDWVQFAREHLLAE